MERHCDQGERRGEVTSLQAMCLPQGHSCCDELGDSLGLGIFPRGIDLAGLCLLQLAKL